MNHLLDPFNLLLLGAAAFVLWRLKSVLGTRTGHEKSPADINPKASSEPARITKSEDRQMPPSPPLSWTEHAQEGSPQAKAIQDMMAADPQFSLVAFLDGAKIAYETIVSAFADADKTVLKSLLAPDIYDDFSAVLDERSKRGEKTQTKIVGIHSAKIDFAELEGNQASLTVRFTAESISARIGRAGEVLEGDPKRVREIVDVWTFQRDVTLRDPNWKLVATSIEQKS